MRKNRSNEIIDHLRQNRGHVFSAEELSLKFGISQRQIRNYISQINETEEVIRISEKGYSISESVHGNGDRIPDSAERVAFIISKLLSANGPVDLYELADELFVSESTVQNDLKKVRRRIEPFRLVLKNSASLLSIEGSEKNKRSLVSHMITHTHYKGFVSDESGRFLDSDYQIDLLKENLIRIFNECSFYYNDYSMNNILLHLVITIDRLQNDYSIEESQISLNVSEVETAASEKICAFLEENYGVTINETERDNIRAILSTNLATLDYRMINRENISSYIDASTVLLVDHILERITDYYLLDPFDDVFFARFSLHIDNLLKRQKISHSVHNPMLMDIKMTYPLIFDIAVYTAGIIEEETGYRINQDEISLIALHIGSFIESNDSNKNKVSAIYIYSDYHQFYQHNISLIQNRFDKDINLLYMISSDDYDPKNMKPDLLISEIPMEDAVFVSAFITPAQIANIEALIRKQSEKKEAETFFHSLEDLFSEDLFFTDLYGEDEFAVLEQLTGLLKDKGLFGDEFKDSVISREKISSTCFIKNVAIPHAIGQTVSHSFISVVTYDRNQKWGNEEIRFLLLFGIAYTERKDFRFVFNHIVDILNNEANVNALSRCRTYREVTDTVSRIVSEKLNSH